MSKRTKFLLGIGVIAALVIGWQVAALAVHDEGKFQLDGDATTNTVPPAPSPATTGTASVTRSRSQGPRRRHPRPVRARTTPTGATAMAWDEEPDPQRLDLHHWRLEGPERHRPVGVEERRGGLPDKDNLQNAFAARYTCPGTRPVAVLRIRPLRQQRRRCGGVLVLPERCQH